jgi:multiple sugar transport system permease protein
MSFKILAYIKNAVIIIVIISALIWVLFPIYWLIVTAFKDQVAVYHAPPIWWPTTNGIENFLEMIKRGAIYSFRSSLIVSSLSTVAVCFIGALAGYAFARFKVGGNFLPFWVLSQRMLPPIVFIIPLFMIFSSLNLINTYHGLALAYTGFNLPYAVWMMRGFFEEIPKEIEESALIDGCGRWRTFIKIALPLAAPGMVATVIFTYILAWNEFLFAVIMMRSIKTFTLPVTQWVFYYGAGTGIKFHLASMQALTAIIPVLILSIYIQKYLIRGLTFGAVKG